MISTIPAARRSQTGLGWLFCLLLVSACADPLQFFDDEFLTAMSLGTQVASIPGDAPAVLIEVENGIGRHIEAQLSWRADDGEARFEVFRLPPGEKATEVLICPIDEITLGDVGDLTQPGAFVRLGGGSLNDPFIEVEAFGVLLKETANYDCGDAVTFTVQSSSKTLSGYQIFAYIRRAEAP